MITFGLTGGIACGKSTVAKHFNDSGIPTVDADLIARQVVEPGTYGLTALTTMFGDRGIINLDGSLDRVLLGEIVFSDADARAQLNALMLPLIRQESARQLKKLHDDGAAIVGYDAALICEMGKADKFRPLVVVSCPVELQIERLNKRNGLTREQSIARIETQMSNEDRIKMADFVIYTDGSLQFAREQTLLVIDRLKRMLQGEQT